MNIECPECGAVYEATKGDFGRLHTCSACNKQFNINSCFICSADGTITWFSAEVFTVLKIFRGIGIGMIIIGCFFLLWADNVYHAEKSGPINTDIEFIIYFVINLIKCTLTSWQGIIGLIVELLGCFLYYTGQTRCSDCWEKGSLLDLNSPAGWKLYRETYPDE